MSWNFLSKNNDARLKVGFYDSVNLLNQSHWDEVVQNKNVYLSIPYLKSLEMALAGEVDFRYMLFYCDDYRPVGAAVVQILDFVDQKNLYKDQLCVVGNKIKHKLLRSMDIKVMVCGNVFATGENGFMFKDEVSVKDRFANLSKALFRLRRAEKANGQVSIMLLKEFWPTSFNQSDMLKSDDFKDFMIDVNMVLEIREEWKNMDDYLASMKAKFRTKANAVFKRSKKVLVRELELPEIVDRKNDIEALYNSVVSEADFKFGELNGEAFVNFKKNLGEYFSMRGFYLNDELIGFSTAFYNHEFVDAGYVGINYSLNHEYAIYQRMLYDYVEQAILRGGIKELRFGRTAEEIKSCLGAEPKDMKLYVKHRNVVSNQLLKPIIDSISPREYEIRHPFKSDFAKH